MISAVGSVVPLNRSLAVKQGKKKPNIIYILADDLGYSELGCYGQKLIRTPNINRLAEEGMRFTQHYSGHAVCAPSRCCFMTGLHTGHSHVRGNMGRAYAGQLPLPSHTVTLPRLLKKAGYATGCMGKWGLGGPGTTGVPWKQGVDYFFGYLDQWRAHSYYPTYLYHNENKVKLNNHKFGAHQKLTKQPEKKDYYKDYMGKEYAPETMLKHALKFILLNRKKPFFLAFTSPIPHVALQVPEKNLKEYLGRFPETPYLGRKGYLPHSAPRAAYAAMVTYLDSQVGRIMQLLKEMKIDDNTIVIFSSDNGPTFNGGSDSRFFKSAGPLKGLKCSLYDGGIRVPFITRWKGKIKPGSSSSHISAFWDMMPTLLELAGHKELIPGKIDGISMAPVLLGKGKQKAHSHLYWEVHGRKGGVKAVRMKDWKGYAKVDQKGDPAKFFLYNLKEDIGEKDNLAEKHPDISSEIKKIMKQGRTQSDYFNFGGPASKKEAFLQDLKERAEKLKAEDN